MPLYRLGNVVNAIASGAESQAIAANGVVGVAQADESTTLAFVREAQVSEVFGAGCRIYIDGATVYADQATDEPFGAGQMVYVSQTQGGGWIIHGSVKS